MTERIVLAALLSALAVPAAAADAFPNYWDRYAVRMSSDPVPEGSDTAAFYRNQFAVMTPDTARAEAAVTAKRSEVDGAAHRDATGATRSKDAAIKCACRCS
jgi:hypothetical protein